MSDEISPKDQRDVPFVLDLDISKTHTSTEVSAAVDTQMDMLTKRSQSEKQKVKQNKKFDEELKTSILRRVKTLALQIQ